MNSPHRSNSPELLESSMTNTYDLSFHPIHLQNSFLSQQRYSQQMAMLYKRNYPATPLFYQIPNTSTPEEIMRHNGVCIGVSDDLPMVAVFPADSKSFLIAFPEAKEVHPNAPVRGLPIRCGNVWKKVERLDGLMGVMKPRDISDANWCRYVHLICIYCGKRYTTLWSLENECGGHERSKEELRWKEVDLGNVERAKKGFEQMNDINEIMESVVEDNSFVVDSEQTNDSSDKRGVVDFNKFLKQNAEVLTKIFECKLCHKHFSGNERMDHFLAEHHDIYDKIVGVFWKRNLNEKEESWREPRTERRERRRSRSRSPRRGFENRMDRRNDDREGLLDDIKAPPSSYLDFLEKLN